MPVMESLAQWINENPGKTFGALAGFVLGILIFTLGIVKTLIVAVLALIGYVIGKSRDDNISIIDEITGLFRRKR